MARTAGISRCALSKVTSIAVVGGCCRGVVNDRCHHSCCWSASDIDTGSEQSTVQKSSGSFLDGADALMKGVHLRPERSCWLLCPRTQLY